MPDQWIVCPRCCNPMVTLLPMDPPQTLLCLKCGVRIEDVTTVTTEMTVDVAEYRKQMRARDIASDSSESDVKSRRGEGQDGDDSRTG